MSKDIEKILGKAAATKRKKSDAVKKPKTKPKKQRKSYNMDKPFDQFIALTIMKSVIEEQRAKLAKKFKGAAFEIFDQKMAESGVKPDSFTAKGHEATALYSLKLRGVISDEMAEKLKKLDIPFTTYEIAAEGLMLNPDIMFDSDILEKMAKALKKVKELEPYFSTIFLPQEPTYSYKLSDETIEVLLEKIADPKLRIKLIQGLTSIQMSQPKINGNNEEKDECIQRAFQILAETGVLNLGISTTKKDM